MATMRAPRRRGSPARAPAQVLYCPFKIIIISLEYFAFSAKKKKRQKPKHHPGARLTRNAAWTGAVGPLRCAFRQLAGKNGVQLC